MCFWCETALAFKLNNGGRGENCSVLSLRRVASDNFYDVLETCPSLVPCVRVQVIFSGGHCAVIIMVNVKDKASVLSGHLLLFLENSRERYIKKCQQINSLKLYSEVSLHESGRDMYNNKMTVARLKNLDL